MSPRPPRSRLGLGSPPSFSYAWPTPSASSSMTLPPSSPTSRPLTHSQYPTFSRAGAHASPSLSARYFPVSRETVPVFMLQPRMVLHFPFSGGVRLSSNLFFLLPSSYVVQIGNGIQLSGIADGLTYDLQLDGVTKFSISPSTSGQSVLAEYDGLKPGNHTLTLIVHNPTNSTSALIAIDHAQITVNSTSPKCVPRRRRP